MNRLFSIIGTGLRELRRRHVFETATVYVISVWLILQVSDIAFEAFGIPDSALKYVFIAASAFFPFALIFAWMFDITPRGLARTPARPESPDRETGPSLQRNDFVVLGTLATVLIAVLYLMVGKVAESPISMEEIQWASRSIPENSIAVLPFVNMSDDESNEYFSDGISEELLDSLAKLEGLHVAARTSSFFFKGKDMDVRTVAQQLGVRTILEGSVRKAGNRVRITAQLINAEDGYHLWSNTYDRELEDIFAVQDEIADSIVRALEPELLGVTGTLQTEAPTSDLEAYRLYLEGQYFWRRRGEAAIRKSIELFQAAIERDPNFARAHTALASAYALLPEYSSERPETAFALAEPIARRAISLADAAGAHAVLAYIHMQRWHWEEAAVEFSSALTSMGNNATIHQWHSNFLNDVAHHELARKEAVKAYELDPVSPVVNIVLAINYVWSGPPHDQLAQQHIAAARALGYGGDLADTLEFILRLRRAEYGEASANLITALRSRKTDMSWVRPFVEAIENPIKQPEALHALARSHERGALSKRDLFLRYLLLDLPDLAFDIAEETIEAKDVPYTWFLLLEAETFRAHPRFPSLVEQIGLVDYWKKYGWPEICQPAGRSFECR